MRRRRFVVLALAGLASGCRQEDDPVSPVAQDAPPEPATVPALSPLEARAAALAERHGAFTVLVEPPFVVLGDEPKPLVKQRAIQTVRWAVTRLKAAYFERDPDQIIEIWLFADDDSYRRNTWKFFRERPDTPYGYYSPSNKALIMNIRTGGGTLVHELVHPFMEANFPEAPSWFDEGLASLYEQCGDEGGEIHGYTNWRLAGLQEALRDGVVPPTSTLTATGEQPFYDDDPGTNYAQARYLCYYLQEHGLLRRYYREFRQNVGEDPTGFETLRRILGVEDMARFDRQWASWVLKLTFA